MQTRARIQILRLCGKAQCSDDGFKTQTLPVQKKANEMFETTTAQTFTGVIEEVVQQKS